MTIGSVMTLISLLVSVAGISGGAAASWARDLVDDHIAVMGSASGGVFSMFALYTIVAGIPFSTSFLGFTE